VHAVAYAPDGAALATGGGDDGRVRIWDARTGQQQQQLTGHTGPVYAVAYARLARFAVVRALTRSGSGAWVPA
jgi:WD40 repeat protein